MSTAHHIIRWQLLSIFNLFHHRIQNSLPTKQSSLTTKIKREATLQLAQVIVFAYVVTSGTQILCSCCWETYCWRQSISFCDTLSRRVSSNDASVKPAHAFCNFSKTWCSSFLCWQPTRRCSSLVVHSLWSTILQVYLRSGLRHTLQTANTFTLLQNHGNQTLLFSTLDQNISAASEQNFQPCFAND